MDNNLNNFQSSLGTSSILNSTSIGSVFLMTFLTTVGLEGLRNYVGEFQDFMIINILNRLEENNKRNLESDPECGLTTGGRSECWWDCPTARVERPTPGVYDLFTTDPTCMEDCYPPDHCLNSLLNDYKAAGGVCKGSLLDTYYPGLFPTSSQECALVKDNCNCPCTEEEIFGGVCEVDCCYVLGETLVAGLCSQKTQTLLVDQENCVHPLYTEKFRLTLRNLVASMCDFYTWYGFYPRSLEGYNKVKKRKLRRKRKEKGNRFVTKKSRLELRRRQENRLTPIQNVAEFDTGVTLALAPPLENTRHRYPWLCSLRSVGRRPFHYCGVTLLARPPGPTVLVTSAHCTYLCKSREGNIVPNCCCPNVGADTCTEREECGTSPTTKEMTGDDVEVICGEWDTNANTEEDYNVVLPIEKIIRHPDFDISRGELNSQFLANDIAVFHVRDDEFERLARIYKIYPACLPSNQLTPGTGIHSGWSKPPPLEFIMTNVPQYLQVYRQFYRQWHYSMTITQCKDPVREFFSQKPLKYPSNSYYPPGTLCATELNGEFCPTSGESGSPLVVKNQEGRFVMEGILSFLKGCSDFDFRGDPILAFLNQETRQRR